MRLHLAVSWIKYSFARYFHPNSRAAITENNNSALTKIYWANQSKKIAGWHGCHLFIRGNLSSRLGEKNVTLEIRPLSLIRRTNKISPGHNARPPAARLVSFLPSSVFPAGKENAPHTYIYTHTHARRTLPPSKSIQLQKQQCAAGK